MSDNPVSGTSLKLSERKDGDAATKQILKGDLLPVKNRLFEQT
jgi:hypothetical protein